MRYPIVTFVAYNDPKTISIRTIEKEWRGFGVDRYISNTILLLVPPGPDSTPINRYTELLLIIHLWAWMDASPGICGILVNTP